MLPMNNQGTSSPRSSAAVSSIGPSYRADDAPIADFACLKVMADGSVPPPSAFEFGLYDASGTLVSTATNGSEAIWNDNCYQYSLATFDNQTLPAIAGIYPYTIREIGSSILGCTLDPSIYHVEVEVRQVNDSFYTVTRYLDGQIGSLPCPRRSFPSLRDGPNGPVFLNTCGGEPPIPPGPCPPCGGIVIVAQKKVTGCCANLQDGQFTFALYDGDGQEVARAKNNDCGNIQFSLSPSAEGHFCYTMREIPGDDCCWQYDRRSFKVCIDVVIVGKGEYEGKVCYPDGIPEFVNCYTCRRACSCRPCGNRCNLSCRHC